MLGFFMTHSEDFIVISAAVTQVFNDVRIIGDGYDFYSGNCICFGAGGLVYMTESTVAETFCDGSAGPDFSDVDVHRRTSFL